MAVEVSPHNSPIFASPVTSHAVQELIFNFQPNPYSVSLSVSNDCSGDCAGLGEWHQGEKKTAPLVKQGEQKQTNESQTRLGKRCGVDFTIDCSKQAKLINPLHQITIPEGLPDGVEHQIFNLCELVPLIKKLDPLDGDVIIGFDLDDMLIQEDQVNGGFKLIETRCREELEQLQKQFPFAKLCIITHTDNSKVESKLACIEGGFPTKSFKFMRGRVFFESENKGELLSKCLKENGINPIKSTIVFIDNDSENLVSIKREFGSRATTVQYLKGIPTMVDNLVKIYKVLDDTQLWSLCECSKLAKTSELFEHLKGPFRQLKEYEAASNRQNKK
ncbi:DUF2608 domain-containing protein [Parashewanella curva]|uniref:DUF2608 domain-containing protein n=1 Tax=Parashewanella curva TaxID=2338552 RepID=A0A3L8PV28_9GAMM|nr:DUF2608 domain-containing protein [Parashewanella curva]RLV59277.1 DUF2608 domain-containing protein [Parashewanella curva]